MAIIRTRERYIENPVHFVRRPKINEACDRRLKEGEEQCLLGAIESPELAAIIRLT